MLRKSILEHIGNTPLLELSPRIYSGPGKIFAKLEYLSPGGSVKDRAALQIVKDAYDSKKLSSGQPVIEMTSGNMGAGLAVVCSVLGNPFYAVMSSGNSRERVKMLEGLGAKVVLVPQVDGSFGKVTGKDIQKATQEAIRLSKELSGFYCDQFHNPSSILAHETTTGPEIFATLEGQLHAFVAAVGSSGTFSGTSKYLKARDSSIVCAAVEPEGSQVLAGKAITCPQHIIQGIGYGSIPFHWEPTLADAIYAVSDQEVLIMKEKLGHSEGLFVGFSAAANVVGAIRLLESGMIKNRDPNVVTILCDHGLKY